MNIGITGHQRLPDQGMWEWVGVELRRALEPYDAKSITAVSSLAIGADELFARLVLEAGGRLHAVLPFEGYERTFDAAHIEDYRSLLAQAETVETLNVSGSDEDAYWAAGRRVVDLSDVLIAVWDGRPARGKGGTADVVGYAVAASKSVAYIRVKNT